MARKISASVGHSGVNKIIDVMTVEELLNGVPPSKGGPTTPLPVLGKANQRLILAIHHFQLHHFGWKGADGRVDPGHQTIKLLNELQSGPPVGTFFVLHQVVNAPEVLRPGRPADWFFHITLPRPGAIGESLFWLGKPGRAPVIAPPRGRFLPSRPITFTTSAPASLVDLEGPALVQMIRPVSGPVLPHHKAVGLESARAHRVRFNAFLPNTELDTSDPSVREFIVANRRFFQYHGQFQIVG